jgi:hydroquinone glucosyltransferase
MVHLVEHFLEANTILVNTFDTVEPEVVTMLRQPKTRRPQVYPVGPLIFKVDNNDAKPPRVACLEWLDMKQARSDIFVSFGSSGALPTEQIRELALGLELSEQRFLRVVWSPSNDGSLSANYHDSESKKDPFTYLPEGFLERTKDMGLVVPSWASQIEVLAHVATGGFLTHCGWNSTLESLVHGLPMVAWPLFVEQGLNAVMLSEGVGAAIRLPKMKEKETIAVAVRELMVGEMKGAVMRAKVAEVRRMLLQNVFVRVVLPLLR